jgi:predicted GTPase
MRYGAAAIAARENGAKTLVDPRPYAVGSIKATFEKYPHVREILPAMGYGERQIADLEATINATPCDVVAIGTPIDLTKLIKINKPAVRVSYDLAGSGADKLETILRSHPRLT